MLHILVDGARRALRLRIEGRSTARGPAPAWISQAAEFEVVALREGSAVVVLEARELVDAAEALGQLAMFEPLTPSATGLSLLRESVEQAIQGREESDVLDDGVLEVVEGWQRVLSHGVSEAEFGNATGTVTHITAQDLEKVARLRKETPPPQRVRVAGWLDLIRHSDRMFTLKLESGATLRGIAEGIGPEKLAGLFGRKAVVSGTAVFRPSGRVLRIEADHIESAADDFSLWSYEPKPALTGANAEALRRPQGPRSGLAAIIGAWPGDEPDEVVTRALKELS
ncbi:MAG TPA: hypothetical protein VF970_07430 [Gemmatimonadales bacterium]